MQYNVHELTRIKPMKVKDYMPKFKTIELWYKYRYDHIQGLYA